MQLYLLALPIRGLRCGLGLILLPHIDMVAPVVRLYLGIEYASVFVRSLGTTIGIVRPGHKSTFPKTPLALRNSSLPSNCGGKGLQYLHADQPLRSLARIIHKNSGFLIQAIVLKWLGVNWIMQQHKGNRHDPGYANRAAFCKALR